MTTIEFLFGVGTGVVLSQCYELLIMWYDGMMWANKDPIRVYMTDGKEIYNEEHFHRNIDEIEIYFSKERADKEETPKE